MCGIIGVVEPAAEGRKANLEKACALMRHRGPDDTGLWSAKGVMLGLRRLAILDLSAAGHQPMLSRDGRLARARRSRPSSTIGPSGATAAWLTPAISTGVG